MRSGGCGCFVSQVCLHRLLITLNATAEVAAKQIACTFCCFTVSIQLGCCCSRLFFASTECRGALFFSRSAQLSRWSVVPAFNQMARQLV